MLFRISGVVGIICSNDLSANIDNFGTDEYKVGITHQSKVTTAWITNQLNIRVRKGRGFNTCSSAQLYEGNDGIMVGAAVHIIFLRFTSNNFKYARLIGIDMKRMSITYLSIQCSSSKTMV